MLDDFEKNDLRNFNSNLNIFFLFKDSEGYTPLHLDILNGNALYVSQILSRPFVNFDLKDEDGFNVLHLAVVRNDLKYYIWNIKI